MSIAEIIIPLDISGDGAPIWDVPVPTLDGKPAPCRKAFFSVKRAQLAGAKHKLQVCLLFAVNPDAPEIKRRIGLLLPEEGQIEDSLAKSAKHIDTCMHPQGFPVSVYEFEITEANAKEFDTSDVEGPVDVMAALAKNQDRQQEETP